MKNLIFLLIFIISACAYTSVSKIDDVYYPPTENIIVLDTLPSKPHKQIAIIEGIIASMTYGATIQDMMAKGKTLGADAIVMLPSDRSSRLVAIAIKYQNP